MNRSTLKKLLKKELLAIAKKLNIKGRTLLRKDELVNAIYTAQRRVDRREASITPAQSRKAPRVARHDKGTKTSIKATKKTTAHRQFRSSQNCRTVGGGGGQDTRSSAELVSAVVQDGARIYDSYRKSLSADHIQQTPIKSTSLPPDDGVEWHGAIDEAGELPHSYGENRITGLIKTPQTVYLFWDYDGDTYARVLASPPYLRVVNTLTAAELLAPIRVDPSNRKHYLSISTDVTFRVELGYWCREGMWVEVARTSALTMPRYGMSDLAVTDRRFVTVPFELSFRRIREALGVPDLPPYELGGHIYHRLMQGALPPLLKRYTTKLILSATSFYRYVTRHPAGSVSSSSKFERDV